MSQELRTLITQHQFASIKGQAQVKEQLKSALLCGRHVILVGPPGVGKTTLARDIAKLLPNQTVNDCAFHCDPQKPSCHECLTHKPKTKVLGGEQAFVRVQGSPDLTAEDLLGDIDPIKALQHGPLSPLAFTPGKIFKANKGVLFFDEVNRCSEKLQNALLQVLEEKKVTIGSYDVDFSADFIFIGTMNPEDTSTEPLSEVFLDRFDLITMSYPETAAIEQEIIKERPSPVAGVSMDDLLLQHIISFIRQLRVDKNLDRKPGVRATIGIVDRSIATAALRGHKRVDIDDVISVLPSVLAHRISLKPSVKYLEQPENYLLKQFQTFVRDHMDGGGL